ncbi:MAG TPA: hypothetical protein PLD88_03925, partial [Candidatus Berkiella sp.]|nr:hypothetical protein [Candidatus Berkiella sp.]
QQILSVNPPFGIQYLINNIPPSATMTSSPQSPQSRKLSEEDNLRLMELQQMTFNLKEDIDAIKPFENDEQMGEQIKARVIELESQL